MNTRNARKQKTESNKQEPTTITVSAKNQSSGTNSMQFKIGTLNVCGFKRRSLYPDFNDLIAKYDIFCTVETKLDIHDIISCQGYNFISNPRKQTVLRKSGGIGIYIKNEIFEYVSSIETLSDYSIWIRISKVFTKLDQDIIIGVCYVPPQSSKYYNEDDFALLEQEIMSFCSESEYVFLTGDFNAQTANMRDFTCSDALFDKYLDLDQDTVDYFDQEAFLLNNNISIDRVSKDTKTNNTDYKIVDICKNNNLLILNGRYGQDAGQGNFTFRDQSVIDYSISSNKGFKILTDFKIEELDRIYSDGHYLLEMNLSLNLADTTSINQTGHENIPDQKSQKSYRLDQQKLPQFNENLDAVKIQDLKTYLDTIDAEVTQVDMNEITNKLSQLFEESAEKTFKTIKPPSSLPATAEHKHKPWFGFNCQKSRKAYTKARRRYRLNRNTENKATLLNASKRYKQTMNKYVNKYKKDQQIKLRKMQKSHRRNTGSI